MNVGMVRLQTFLKTPAHTLLGENGIKVSFSQGQNPLVDTGALSLGADLLNDRSFVVTLRRLGVNRVQFNNREAAEGITAEFALKFYRNQTDFARACATALFPDQAERRNAVKFMGDHGKFTTLGIYNTEVLTSLSEVIAKRRDKANRKDQLEILKLGIYYGLLDHFQNRPDADQNFTVPSSFPMGWEQLKEKLKIDPDTDLAYLRDPKHASFLAFLYARLAIRGLQGPQTMTDRLTDLGYDERVARAFALTGNLGIIPVRLY